MRYLRKQIDRSLIAHGKRLDRERKACVLSTLLVFGRYGDGSYTDFLRKKLWRT